jgi:ATP-dependent Clp protease ATP-binding subunit ClpC
LEQLEVSGMNYNFTDRVRNVLEHARDEAIALQHDYLGTEHILLGLIREDGVAASVLVILGADAAQIRQRMVDSIGKGTGSFALGELPYTTRGRRALEVAIAEARDMNHSYIGTEHLLLGLLREESDIAAQVLNASGVSYDAARRETLKLLGSEEPRS